MRARDDVKMTFKLIQLMLFLFMYVHLIAWLWFIIVGVDEAWIPPTDFLFFETDIYDDDADIWR